ncbi:MAG: FHA domain-containing protein [Ancalomicrobiaceae bacterium]|nr:FHA domain-containing protein [Ancalomicrobiaceae bacterium]
MTGSGPRDESTRVARHLKVGETERVAVDTDDLGTYFVTQKSKPPFAKLVIVGGPGAGNARPIFPGTNSIGREASNRVPLDFGDDTISRKQHAVIVVDDRDGSMQILDGGKINPIVVNGTVVTGKSPIRIGDTIEIGTTTVLVEAL